MDFLETARQLVRNIIATALSMTVAAVDALLSNRPDLIERIDQLAMQLRANAAEPKTRAPGDAETADLDDPGEMAEIDTDQLLLAYN